MLLCPFDPQFFQNDGTVASGCKLFTYATGTTTLLTSYQTQAGTAHTNPITLDSAGRVQPALWLTAGLEYRLRLETAAGVLIDEWDDIYGVGDGSSLASLADLADTSDTAKGDALVGVKVTATGAAARTQHAKNNDLFSSKDFGALADGSTDDITALTAMAVAAQPFVMPTESASLRGSYGPALGSVNRIDYATIGSTELLTNGTFTGAATGWTLSNFTYSANTITHTAGTVGTASQSITIKDFRHYLVSITITTTTRGTVDLQFDSTTMLDDSGYYTMDTGTVTYTFPWLSPAAATATFRVITDTAWAGSIDTISLIEVTDEMPLSFINVPTDDTTWRIPNGLKFGRYNAGVLAMGDRQTMALAGSAAVWNVAIGPRSLQGNLVGFENTAVGAFAGRWTTTSRNTYYGYSAGKYNTLGEHLTALGYKALGANGTGNRNTGVGHHALLQATSGSDNTAIGWQAFYNVLTTSGNTAVGSQCAMNTRGTENTYLGALAGYLNASTNTTYTYSYGTTIGAESKVYGESGTVLGFNASVGVDGSPVDNAMALGANATTKLASSAKIGSGLTKFGTAGRLYSGEASNSDATAAGITYTAAQFASPAFTRTGPGAGFSDTTPTAAAIVAAIPGAEVGMGYEIWIRNATGFTLTLLAGSGVTLGGTTTIATVQSRLYKVFLTNVGSGTEAVTVVGICSAAN